MNAWLSTRRGYWCTTALIVAVALAVHGQVLHAGYLLDDYAQLAMLEGHYPAVRAPWDLFTFSSGDPAETRRLMDVGIYPWWSHPQLRLSMFRPLSSLLIALDHRLFGLDPLAAHLHSFLYFIGLLVAVAALLRRALPTPIATLALACFAFDQAHTVTLGWLANRTAVLSALWLVLSLLAYRRFRRTGSRWHQTLCLLAWSLSLAAGEYALCGVGYFVAFEWLGQREAVSARLRALGTTVAPPLLVYLAVRHGLGGGPTHSGVYVDPIASPLRFLAAAAARYPALLADALLTLRAESWSFGSPATPTLTALGWLPPEAHTQLGPYRRLHAGIGWLALAAALLAMGWLWRGGRGSRDREAVILAAGACLATLPVSGSLPGSRLLLLPCLGFSALIGAVIHRLLTTGVRRRLWAAPLALAVAVMHGVVEPAGAYREASLWAEVPDRVRQAIADAPLGTGTAVLTGSGDPALLIYMGLVKRLAGLAAPAQTLALSGNRHPLRLTRAGATTLEVRYPPGRSMLGEPFEEMFRGPEAPLVAGSQVRIRGVTIEVLDTTAVEGVALPTAVRVVFDRPLSDPDVRLVIPTPQGVRSLPLPEEGASQQLPAPAIPLPPGRSRPAAVAPEFPP